jgi:hypothetical protein
MYCLLFGKSRSQGIRLPCMTKRCPEQGNLDHRLATLNWKQRGSSYFPVRHFSLADPSVRRRAGTTCSLPKRYATDYGVTRELECARNRSLQLTYMNRPLVTPVMLSPNWPTRLTFAPNF